MLKFSLVFCVLFLTGCASWTTPSVYSNQSTATGNVINAQGTAADRAAAANVSFNCPSCTAAQKAQILNYLAAKKAVPTWQQKAKQDMGDTITWRLNRALDQALFEVLQNY